MGVLILLTRSSEKPSSNTNDPGKPATLPMRPVGTDTKPHANVAPNELLFQQSMGG